MTIDINGLRDNAQKILNKKLFQSTLDGDIRAAESSIDDGADINSIHEHGSTAILAAATFNHVEIVELLRDRGADIELANIGGATPLWKAAYECNSAITKNLIRSGANIEAINHEGYSPIYAAISSGCIEDTKLLLDAGATIYSDYQVSYDIHSPLFVSAFIYNQPAKTSVNDEIYDVVGEHYKKITKPEIEKINAKLLSGDLTYEVVIVRYEEDLSWVRHEFPENIKVTIYNKGADDLEELPSNCHIKKIDNVGYLGGSYLKHIADNYNQLADKTLFLQGNPYDVETLFPLVRMLDISQEKSSCNNIYAKCIETSIKAEDDFLTNKMNWGETSRYHKFTGNHTMPEFTSKFIANYSIDEPLHVTYGALFAVDKSKILHYPIEHYSDMLPVFNKVRPKEDHYLERLWDLMFEHIDSLLFKASSRGMIEAMNNLLDKGADIDSVHEYDSTSIVAATTFNQIEAVELLKDRGADIELANRGGATPLWKSAHGCLPHITEKMIGYGADIEVFNKEGNTPLQAAVSSGCVEDVKSLLAAGADILIDNAEGEVVSYNSKFQTAMLKAAFLRDESSAHAEIDQIIQDHYWKILEERLTNITIDTSKTFEVVIVRYEEEDLSWIAKEFPIDKFPSIKITLYNKGPNNLENLQENVEVRDVPNVGFFGGSILKHIADNYSDLADRMLFLQAGPYEQKIYSPFVLYAGELQSNCKNIYAKCDNTTLSERSNSLKSITDEDWAASKYKDFNRTGYDMIEHVHQYINPDYDPNSELQMVWGAEFAVDKETVYNRDQSVYQAMLPVYNKPKPIEDFGQEKVWDILFDKTSSRPIAELNYLLFEAALSGNDQAITELLNQGAEINSTAYGMNITPIFAAVANDKESTVRLLREKKSNINIANDNGITPLFKASLKNNTPIAKFLIDSGADIEAVSKEGNSAIYAAISSNAHEVVELLLAKNASIYTDDYAYEPRHPLFLSSFLYDKDKEKYGEVYNSIMDHYQQKIIPEQHKNFVDNEKTFEVVIARYNEDLSWIEKEFPVDKFSNVKITIYNKGADDLGDLPANCNVISMPNVGYLGGTYLKHIIDNYNQLADRTLYLQGQPYDVEVYLPLIRYKTISNSTCKNIYGKCIDKKLGDMSVHLSNAEWEGTTYSKFIKGDFNLIDFTNKFAGDYSEDAIVPVVYGAEFAVDKEKILCRSLEHYEEMLPEFNEIYPMSDHGLERIWDLLLGSCEDYSLS